MRRWCLALLPIPLLPCWAADPPPAAPTIREQVDVQLVQVNFLAMDRAGRPVLDLKPQDIEVLENGERQRVAFLESYYGAPAGSPSSAAPRAAPTEEPRGVPRSSPGRWLLLFVDAYTSSSRTRVTSLAAVEEFLGHHLSTTDRAALVLFDGKLHLLQTFTNDRELLLHAAATAQGRLMRASDNRSRAIQSLLEGVESCSGTPTTGCVQRSVNEYEDARLREAQDLLFALTTLTRSLAPIPDIKTIVLFSDGFSRTPFSDGFDAVRSTLGLRLAQQLTSYAGDRIDRALSDFAGSAAEARVSVFTIYPGGGPGASSVGADRAGPGMGASREDIDVYRRSEQNYAAGLSEVARRSGGHHTQGNDALAQLSRMWRLSDGLYTASYYLTDVRVSRKPLDIRVRSLRKGVVIETRREIPRLPPRGVLPGSLAVSGSACGPPDGRRSADIRLSIDRRMLEFVGTSTLQASLSVYLSIADPSSGKALFDDYRLLQIERSPKDAAPPEEVDPGLEMTLRVPCRPLEVTAVVVDSQSGARGEFAADITAAP